MESLLPSNPVVTSKKSLHFRENRRNQFNVVMVYEDLVSGLRAKEIYDFLLQELGEKCDFNYNLWSYEILQLADIRASAAAETSQADMVFVAGQGDKHLPTHVRDWLDQWTGALEGRSIALVALVNSDTVDIQDSPLCHHLKRVSDSHGFSFFVPRVNFESEPGCYTGFFQNSDAAGLLNS
jgi:hypothetical protein